jgi:hypothetical protein
MRRPFVLLFLAILLFGAGFGVARAYFGWSRVSTPCSTISQLASIGQGRFAVVCDDEPGTILVQQ